MKFIQTAEPQIEKPLMIAALQDMGNVGNIVIDFINKSKKSIPFRRAESTQIPYVLDKGGYIEIPNEGWQYNYAKNTIVFGGGVGQPKTNEELHELCQDVVNTAKKYSVKIIYSLGGFHTTRPIRGDHKTYVTTTSQDLTRHLEKMGISMTPTKSVITGFNGLVLGYAKMNDIQGIGLYGELNDPSIPQYKTAKSVLQTLEKLTYQSFGDYHELDVMAEDVERKIRPDWNKDF